MLLAKGKDAQADMVRNIIPNGGMHFRAAAEQKGLGHAVLCRTCSWGDPRGAAGRWFLTDYEPGVTAICICFADSGKSQLSIWKSTGLISLNMGLCTKSLRFCIEGLVKSRCIWGSIKPSIHRRYLLTPISLKLCADVRDQEVEQLADAIVIHAQQGFSWNCWSNGRRFDCGSVDGFRKFNTNIKGDQQINMSKVYPILLAWVRGTSLAFIPKIVSKAVF